MMDIMKVVNFVMSFLQKKQQENTFPKDHDQNHTT